MARPLRIEYEDAYYHVMNRGRGRQCIFHGNDYYLSYLTCLEEAHRRFGLVVHAYCLMGNHYHLLVSTPRGNLSRAMRHINGQYTQRYNRLKRTDGPLFRGRYKAILIDAGSYLLPVSRYIHRNPIEIRRPLVKHVAAYRWSSYPAYINQAEVPGWLCRDTVLGELGTAHRYAAYRRYVGEDMDEETKGFYRKHSVIMGGKAFAEEAHAKAQSWDREISRGGIMDQVEPEEIIRKVAAAFACPAQEIYRARRGRGEPNLARWFAMKLCQDYSGKTLAEMGKLFGVSNYCTVSQTVARLRERLREDRRLQLRLNTISKDLTP